MVHSRSFRGTFLGVEPKKVTAIFNVLFSNWYLIGVETSKKQELDTKISDDYPRPFYMGADGSPRGVTKKRDTH